MTMHPLLQRQHHLLVLAIEPSALLLPTKKLLLEVLSACAEPAQQQQSERTTMIVLGCQVALSQAGVPVKSIAPRVGVSHQTIYRWLAKGHGPHAGLRKRRAGSLDWMTPYLRERWEAGQDNGLHLWEELKARGYTGSLRSIYRRLALFRGGPRPYRSPSPASAEAVPRSPLDEVTPGKVIGWIIAREDDTDCRRAETSGMGVSNGSGHRSSTRHD